MTLKVAFYKGREHLADRGIAYWTDGPYSHVELVICSEDESGESLCISSSIRDGGVRAKWIDLNSGKWDVIELGSDFDTYAALLWYERNRGKGYDFLGLCGFVWRPIQGANNRYFCSEAVGEALGFTEAWRFSPNDLYHILKR